MATDWDPGFTNSAIANSVNLSPRKAKANPGIRIALSAFELCALVAEHAEPVIDRHVELAVGRSNECGV